MVTETPHKRPCVDLFSRLAPENIASCLDFVQDADEILPLVPCSRAFDHACKFVSCVHFSHETLVASGGLMWRRFPSAEHVVLSLPCASLELLAGYMCSTMLDRCQFLEICLYEDDIHIDDEDGGVRDVYSWLGHNRRHDDDEDPYEVDRRVADFCRVLRGLARAVARGALPRIEELSLFAQGSNVTSYLRADVLPVDVADAFRLFVRALPADVALRTALKHGFFAAPQQQSSDILTVRASDRQLFDELLERDVDLDRHTEHMECALMSELGGLLPWESEATIERLLALGADPHARSPSGSVLEFAVASGNAAAVRAILAAGARDGAGPGTPVAPCTFWLFGVANVAELSALRRGKWALEGTFADSDTSNWPMAIGHDELTLWRHVGAQPRGVDGLELAPLGDAALLAEFLRFRAAAFDQLVAHGVDLTRRYSGTSIFGVLLCLLSLDGDDADGGDAGSRTTRLAAAPTVREQLVAIAQAALNATRETPCDDPDRRTLQRAVNAHMRTRNDGELST